MIYVGRTPEEISEWIVRALNEDGEERIVARREKVRLSTWDSKAELLLNELFSEGGGYVSETL